MNDTIIIALITTAGNRDLTKPLNSIKNQEKKVFDIFIGSEIEIECNEKVLVNPYKKGLARNTNQSLIKIKEIYKNKKNVFIATLDDDDEWKCSYIKDSLKQINSGCNFVASWVEVRREQKYWDSYKFDKEDISIKNFILGNPGIQGSNKVFNLDIALEVGGMPKDINVATDRAFNISLLSHPEIRIGIIEKENVIYNKDDLRERITNDENRINQLRLFYKHFRGFIDEKDIQAINLRHKKIHNFEKVILW